MDELFSFYKNALLNNLCKEYSNEWNASKDDKKRLFDLSLRQQALPYVATSTYKGWGLSIDYICNYMGEFINGKYIGVDCDGVHGYTYERYCRYDKPFVVNTDIIDIMQCNSVVSIQQTKCPIIYISNKSKMDIDCMGFNSVRIYLFDESVVNLTNVDEDSSVLVYKYSTDCKVNKTDNCFGNVKEFIKDLRL